jgi:peptide/nickel transport system substrate-binding protein
MCRVSGRLLSLLALPVSIALAALAAASGAAGAAVPEAATEGRPVLTVGMLQDADSLNPFAGTSTTSVQVFGLIYDRLTDYRTADNRPAPGLATSWTTSADGLTWTFTLRDGLTWSDGEPLTAADVAFTYTTLLRTPAAATASAVKTFAAVTAPDARTVVIRTRVPTATMLALDVPIVPAHVWSRLDPLTGGPPGAAAAAAPAPETLVGSGPFRLVEARSGERYRFEPRPGHWRGSPKVGELVLRYYSNGDAAALALRAGELDLVPNLTPAQADGLGRDRVIRVSEARGSRFSELSFNIGATLADGTPFGDGHPALRDVRVRTAIEHLVDRRMLVDKVLAGHGDPGGTYFPPTYAPWSWLPDEDARRGFDPAAAGALLDAAGYVRGPDGVRVVPAGREGAGRPLRFRLLVPVERAHYGQSATYLVSWLRDAGIVAEPVPADGNRLGELVGAGQYDMFLGGWLLDPDPDFLMSVHTCGARPATPGGDGNTDTFVCDAELDRLYAAQATEVDAAARAALVHRFQERLHELAPQVVLYYPGVLEAYRGDRFTGLLRRPADTGSVVGPWSYVAATPVTAADPVPGSRWPLVAGVAAAALVLGLAVLLALRYRAARDDRE